MIHLVTDSTCDLPEGKLAALDVTVVPINIHFATQEYQEGETLGYAEFFQKIEDLDIIPTTSQPSPGEFANTYRRLAQQGASTILSLHVTGKLSGTVQSASLAASLVQDEVDVRVFDSLAGSAGTGFMILEAADMLAQGATADTILQRWSTIRDQVCILFILDTLKYAHQSGRVSALQSAIASMLDIKPLVRLDEGSLILADRVRTRRAALARMLDMLEEALGHQPLNLAVIHARNPVAASDLLEKIQSRFVCRQTFVAPLATSLVTNLGDGTLGVVAYPAE